MDQETTITAEPNGQGEEPEPRTDRLGRRTGPRQGRTGRQAWNKGLAGSTTPKALAGPIGRLAQLSDELDALEARRAEIQAEIQELRPVVEKLAKLAGIV